LEIPSLEYYIVLEQHKPLGIVMRRTLTGFVRETYEGVDSVVELPSLGCHLSFKDVYDGIEFTATCVQEPDPEYQLSEIMESQIP
jgi:hypothetical protein